MKRTKLLSLLIAVCLLFSFAGCTAFDLSSGETVGTRSSRTAETRASRETTQLDRDGSYTSKDDVALYLHTYRKLPSNYITKKQARALGWDGGPLEPYAPGKSIGGDYFGNYEGKLPKKSGRSYHECDIDSTRRSRGGKRIVYSNDGLIYYTANHYETFTLLYGEE